MAAKKLMTWEKVLGAIGESKALPVILAHLQALQNKGCHGHAQPVPAASLDRAGLAYTPGEPIRAVRDFSVSYVARETVCKALTYGEDWLDYNWPKDKGRASIAKMRRALEAELERASVKALVAQPDVTLAPPTHQTSAQQPPQAACTG